MRRFVASTFVLAVLWILIVAAAVLAKAVWFAAPPISRGEMATIERHLVEALDRAVRRGQLGSAGLVLIQDGAITLVRGFGVANVETGARVDPIETAFHLSSFSKSVTAWGVMKLVETGRITLDDPAVRHLKRWQFPQGDPRGNIVTARHLLTHTASAMVRARQGLGLAW
jgi:CubicO group peptidase (beta-lactamase class C family)